MQRLYKKSEIWFAVVWIIAYVVGTSVADGVSEAIGLAKSITILLHSVMITAAVLWMKQNGLFGKYGFCAPGIRPSACLFYLPLVGIATVNLWCGVQLNMPILDTVLYVYSMLLVGFLEELIFRGFLFRAMEKDNLKAALIVSALTFGIGHVVNLVNGSGADLLSNICQICYATAGGFMFVVLFHKGGSLWPCILTHAVLNAGSAFANAAAMSGQADIIISVILCVVSAAYALFLYYTVKPAK